jgi:hypothetical protein
MSILDRILASVDWDAKHPLSQVTVLPKEISDHNLLVIKFDEKLQIKDPIFRFEKWWLEVEGFTEIVKNSWGSKCPFKEPVVVWQFKIRILRKKLRSWSRNIEVELKKKQKHSPNYN